MDEETKINVDYDYSIALIFSSGKETLIGGTAEILNRAIKSENSPNLKIKGLDVYYCDLPLGTFAADVNQNAVRAEILTDQADMFYTNLINENANANRVADTKRQLEKLFCTDRSYAVRLLAKTLLVWYEAAKGVYMSGEKVASIKFIGKSIDFKSGLPLKQEERARLGVQFKADTDALIEDTFTALKRKKSPREAEIFGNILARPVAEIADFLAGYKRYMSENKAFCIYCKDCERHFISASWNAQYCPDCKTSRKKTSKQIFLEKNSVGFRQTRQLLQYSFENFMSKSAIWKRFTPAEQKEYKQMHSEFLEQSTKNIQAFEQGDIDEKALNGYFSDVRSKKLKLEQDGNHKE